MNKLNLATDPSKAKQNEELLATISKATLNYMTLDVLTTMIEMAKKRLVLLLEKYNKLKELYADLDSILSEYIDPLNIVLDSVSTLNIFRIFFL